MNRARRKGYALLAGGLCSLLWLLACPTYFVNGPTSYHYESHPRPGTTRLEDRHFPEAGRLWGGFVVIWSLVAAGYFLIPERGAAALRSQAAEVPSNL